MNKSGFGILGILVVSLLFMPGAQAEPDTAPVELTITLESQAAFTNRTKYFWSSFVGCPPRKYKRNTFRYDSSGCAFATGSYGTGGVHIHQYNEYLEYVYDATSDTPVCTNWSGVYSNYWETWGGGSGNYVIVMTNCNMYNGDWGTDVECGAPCPETNLVTRTTHVITNFCRWDSNETNYCYVSECQSETLSDEYTTEELLSPDGLTYPGSNWYTGVPSQPAFSSIFNDEDSATIQKMRYRFKARAEADTHFTIYYLEHYADDNGYETNRLCTLDCTGTGEEAYYPQEGPIEVVPPYTNSVSATCTNIVGARIWITMADCSSFGSGCAACTQSPGAFSAENRDAGVSFNCNLGKDSYGAGSGALVIAAASPRPSLVTPGGLDFVGSLREVELIRGLDGNLRQVKSAQLLADIVVNSATSYTIECYSPNNIGAKDQDGWYTNSGTPISSATIAQGGSTNEIIMTVVNGSTSTYTYTWSEAAHGWTLVSGGGQRRETRSWNATVLARTNTVSNGNNQIVYQEVRYYQSLSESWGNVMVKRVVGPGGPALTTQWYYYDNPQADGTNFGKLKMVIRPSGSWTSYQYATNGLLTKEVSQFLNAPTNAPDSQCRVVVYDYTPLTSGCSCTCRIESLLGQEISRQYTIDCGSEIRTIQCQTPGNTNLNAADNLVTTRRNYYDENQVDRPKSVVNSDGTVQIYSYETNGTYLVTTVLSGQPDVTGTNVVDGTQTVTQTGIAGEMISRVVTDIASQIEISHEYNTNDELGRTTRTDDYLGNTYVTTTYACCGVDTTTDRDGTTTQYSYDALKRQVASTRHGITTTNILDAAGNLLATVRIGTDSSQIVLRQAAYDTAGGVTSETNALNGRTSYSRALDGSGQTVKTTTYPDGGTRVETYYQDGSLRSVTGTAVFPTAYEYGVESENGIQRAYTTETKLDAAGSPTSEWTKTYSDMLGRTYKTLYADGASSRSFYSSQGQLWKQVDPDGVTTLYQYNGRGEVEYTAADLNTNSIIDFGGADRISRTVLDVVSDNGFYVRRAQTYAWTTDGQDTSSLITTRQTSTDGLHTWTTTAGATTETETHYFGNGMRQVTTYAPDRSYTVTVWQYGQIVSFSRYDVYGSLIGQSTYGYDSHGRQSTITDPRNGTTINYFNAGDQISGIITPSPDGVQSPQVTTNFFDRMGRIIAVRLPDNTLVTNKYSATGLLTNTFGSRAYPVAYSFDAQGRMKTMTTWQSLTGNQGTATTMWNYNSARGWLDNKRYADNQGPSYTYTAAGRLKTRTWARGLATTYEYNNAGDLTTMAYSDGTPAVSYGHDRRGRQTTVTQGSISTSRSFDDAGNLLAESYSGGPLAGLSVTNGYDEYLRRTNLSAQHSSTPLLNHSFAYDNASRLQAVTDGTNSAAYIYVDYSPLVGQIEFASDGVPYMLTTKSYDSLNRLTNIVSSTNGVAAASFAYAYNAANQRTNAALADGQHWVYTYDSLGQVTSGRKYWADGTPLPGQQFVYGFDDIGNRRTAATGGDQWGANLRYQNYTANNLNQYLQRTVPGYAGVLGTANSNAAVTLWRDDGSYSAALRKGDYFWAELPVNNATGAVWLTLTNLAVLNDGSNPDVVASTVGQVFLPRTAETFGYDADGNLTNDGRWSYTWDAENRLVKLAPNTAVGPQNSIQFDYDWQGRRIRKQVWPNSSWTGNPTNDVRFVYDGWNLITVLNSSFTLQTSFMWGLDLSGTLQGAGGVGGLLFTCDLPSAIGHCAPAYDGNGNVMALVSMSGGTNCAIFEYGPFGEVIRATGPMAKANPFRFSTKCQDDETDLLYYGYRYYNANTGRWLSHDPINEEAFRLLMPPAINIDEEFVEQPNSYLFVGNGPLDQVDILGLWHGSGHHQIFEAWLDPSKYRDVRICCCKIDVIGLLERASDELDARTGLWMKDAYMHAMRRPFQSVASAKAEYDDFIGGKLRFARGEADAAGRDPVGRRCSDIEEAIWALGEAVHAFQDSYSPSHTGFQLWAIINDPSHAFREPDSAIPGTGVIGATGSRFGGDLGYILSACSR